MKIGNAKYGNEFKKRNDWKLKDGEQAYRILPPLGELAESGRWSVFWNVHWGYKNLEGKHRPFQSPLVKNHKTKMIDVADVASDRLDQLKAELLKAKAAGNQELFSRLDTLVGQKGVYNIDNNHHMNVMDTQGNIGTLKIRHRCKVALDALIKKLRSEGVDPLSVDNGRFIIFRRDGMGTDTTFTLSVLKRKIDAPGFGIVEQDVVHVLTPEIQSRLKAETADLTSLFKRPTSEQVAEIVKSSDIMTGKSAVIDGFLYPKNEAAPLTASSATTDDDAPGSDYQEPKAAGLGNVYLGITTNPGQGPQVVITPLVQPLPTGAGSVVPVVTPVQNVATPVAVTTATVAQALTPPQSTAEALEKQANDDFLKSLGLPV